MPELTVLQKLHRLCVANLLTEYHHVILVNQYTYGTNADKAHVRSTIAVHVDHCLDTATDMLNEEKISMSRCRAMRQAARTYEFSEFVKMRDEVKR